MKKGENILSKLCFKKNEMIMTMIMAIRKGNGTGILEKAASTCEVDTN